MITPKLFKVYYGVDIQAERKSVEPLHMSVPSCRTDFGTENVRSMNGIEGPVHVAFLIYMEESENNKSNRKGLI